MAIDTEQKRKSIAAIGHIPIGPVVVPDSSIDGPDRQAIGYSYAGIAAESPGGIVPVAMFSYRVRRVNN